MKRKYHITVKRSFSPHYNSAVGRVISTEHEFKEALKIASHNASESSGMEHRYVPVDLRDKPGVTDENADVIEQSNRTRGLSHQTKTYFT